MNKVILMGRLTANPDYRQTPQGTSTCRFTVAVNRDFVSKNSGQREADFINVQAWRGTADFVSRYFTKGKPIVVEGSLRNNNYTDKNGVQRYEVYVLADSVSFTVSDTAPNGNGGYGNYGNNYQQNDGMGYQGGYGNGAYNGGYNQNSYAPQGGGNGYYQAPPQPTAPPVYQQPANNAPSVPNAVPNDTTTNGSDSNIQIGDLNDFEEILSDGEIPF